MVLVYEYFYGTLKGDSELIHSSLVYRPDGRKYIECFPPDIYCWFDFFQITVFKNFFLGMRKRGNVSRGIFHKIQTIWPRKKVSAISGIKSHVMSPR